MAKPSPSSPWVLSTLVLLGVVVGILADRGVVSVSGARRAEANAGVEAARAATAGGGSTSRLVRGGDEAAIYEQLGRQYQQFEQVNRTFELVSKAVSPAVVHIVTQKATRHGQRLLQFEETGSGVIVRLDADKDGVEYVLTNNHVIEGAGPSDIQVFLQDGRVIHPDRCWNDAKSDVGVLRLAVKGLPSARLGNSDDAAVGSWVLALGSPFGLTHSVSQGIISARNRHQQELQDDGNDNQDFLQTDAAINPGNSGGPLVNLKGEVIGINTAIASNGGGSEGVGFSIPINLARWIMEQLIAKGRVRRGAMGVDLDDVTASQAVIAGLDRPRGALVRLVHPGSPASQSGLRKGDVILQFNGVDVLSLNHLINLVAMAPIGDLANLIVWRDDQERAHKVTVGDLDRVAGRVEKARSEDGAGRSSRSGTARSPQLEAQLGATLLNIDARSARKLGIEETTAGVGVLQVDPEGPLAGSLQPRDIIYALNGQWVRSLDELQEAVARTADAAANLWVERPATGKRFQIRVP